MQVKIAYAFIRYIELLFRKQRWTSFFSSGIFRWPAVRLEKSTFVKWSEQMVNYGEPTDVHRHHQIDNKILEISSQFLTSEFSSFSAFLLTIGLIVIAYHLNLYVTQDLKVFNSLQSVPIEIFFLYLYFQEYNTPR